MIQSGTIQFGVQADDAQPWGLHIPEHETAVSGQRVFRSADIPFERPFDHPPRVVLSLAGIQADGQFDLRVDLTAEAVQAEEFNIHVTAFEDSVIYGMRVNWIAYD